MFERDISTDDVSSVLREGRTIQEYPDDTPYPSKLILGFIDQTPLHVVASYDTIERGIIIITVYEPDRDLWDNEFKARLKK